MRRVSRTFCLGVVLSAVSALPSPSVLNAQESPAVTSSTSQLMTEVIELRPDDVTAIVASRGSLSGNAMRHERSGNVVQGFESPEDSVTWTVNAPQEDDYVVNVLFSKREQTNIEVSSGETVLSAPSSVRTWDYRPYFWRQKLPGTITPEGWREPDHVSIARR